MILLSKYVVFVGVLLAFVNAIPTTEQHIITNANAQSSQSSLWSALCSKLIHYIWLPEQAAGETATSHLPQKNGHSKYGDDVVLRFTIQDDQDAKVFAEAVDTLYLDVWEASEDWADVRVSKTVLAPFLDLLPERMRRSYLPIITNLPQAIYDTYPAVRNGRSHKLKWETGPPHDLFFDNYQPLAVIYPTLRQLAEMSPERARLFTLGTSYEGRDIPAFQIGLPYDEKTGPRSTIVITAGAHAREWISTSTAMYLLRSLLHSPHSMERLIMKMLENFDFIFIPVLNPDGYEYTWTTDRLWRKNRQDTTLPFCRGIDLDRNFPSGWDGDSQIENPCSESYAGEHSLQATEAGILAGWARNETELGKRTFTAFLDLHSYSQEILYPYSYTCDRQPHNLEDLEEIAWGLAKAFRVATGHFYGVDSACEGTFSVKTTSKSGKTVRTQIEESGGSALDYFYQDMQVKYAFQIKLRDTGTYGFLLPKENILPTGIETFNALVSFGKWLLGNRGIEGYTGMSAAEIWGIESNANTTEDLSKSKADEIEEEDDAFWYRRRRR